MNELNKLIKNSHYKIEAFLYELNISRDTFWRIRKGKRPLRANEIYKLSKLLKITEQQIIDMVKEMKNWKEC